jgi:bla regulator protein blaR1
MIVFIIKSTLCLGLLGLIYKLVLESEKTHHFNRFFLIGSLIFSFSVPFLNFEIETNLIQETAAQVELLPIKNHAILAGNQAVFVEEKTIDFESICLIIWILGSILLVVKFIKNLLEMMLKISRNRKVKNGGIYMVLLVEKQVICSFFNYIFINQNELNQTEKELLLHEKCHAEQWHTLDVILIELLQVFFWFNPFLILYKTAIKLNHEFLADDAVNLRFQNVVSYQYLLLGKVIGQPIALTSSSNFQLTKQRLTMMTKHTSALVAASKIVATLFCTLLIGIGFSSTIIAQNKAVSTKQKVSVEIDLTKKNPHNYEVNVEKGEFMMSYDDPRKSFNTPIKKYSELTDIEKKNIGDPYFPAEKMNVTEANIVDWLNAAKYGVWINDKKVSNKELKKYQAEDFHDYFISKLYGKARTSVTYLYQIDITTNDYFKSKVLKDFASKPFFSIDMRTKKGK